MPAATEQWALSLANRVLAGKYRLIRLLGEGGMGAVFEAEQLPLARRVAVKLVRPSRMASETALQRFQLEAHAAARVADGGVPQVIDFDRDPELGPFQVMEILHGESLRERLRRGPLSTASAYGVLLQVLDLLARVHAAGIVHRDIKPSNVFLEQLPDGTRRVRLLDFGIARVRDPALPAVTLEGATPMGTAGYSAPEQLAGRDVDHRGDLYSAAIVLYACLSGREPFDELNTAQVMAATTAGRVPSLRAARPDLSERLQRAYEWATAFDPARRPASAAELGAALRASQLDEAAPPGAFDAAAHAHPPAAGASAQPATPRSARSPAASTLDSSSSAASSPPWPAAGYTPSPPGAGAYVPPGSLASTPPGVLAHPAPGAAVVPAGQGAPSYGSYPSHASAPSPPVLPLASSAIESGANAPRTVGARPNTLLVTVALMGAALLATTIALVVMVVRDQHHSDVASPSPPPGRGDAPPVASHTAQGAPDPLLERARADMEQGLALAEAQRFDEAEPVLVRALEPLSDPMPEPGSPRADALGRVYLALGDVHAARIPARAAASRAQPVTSSATAFMNCYAAVTPEVDQANFRYAAVYSDPRFGDQAPCGYVRVARMYETLAVACADARSQYLSSAAQFYRMADRAGPCREQAREGLTRVNSTPH